MKFNKILVIQYNMLGDVVLSTGIVRALRAQFPHSKIAFLVSPETADLVRLPFVDEVIAYDKGMPMLPVIRKVWRYDVALLLDFKYRSAVIPFLACIPVRAGLAHKRKLFMTHAIPLPKYDNEMYITEYMSNIIKDSIGLNITHDVTQLCVAEAMESDKWAVDNLLTGKWNSDSTTVKIAIAPFSSTHVKDWPVDYYSRFIQRLKEKMNCSFAILGGHPMWGKIFVR